MKMSSKKSFPSRSKAKQPKKFEVEKHLRAFCDATSQELGTVLATIVGELEYALATENNVTRDRSVLVALSAAEKALSLARNLRYFSIHTKLDVAVVDLSQILLDTVELVERDLERARIKIAVLAEASTCVQADGRAIQQVILNLLDNAQRHVGADGQITLSLRQRPKFVEIQCADSGEALSMDELDRIFEPYSAADGRNPWNLGLSVCKALVESHGGDIRVASRAGSGTQVTIELPFDPKLSKPTNFAEERRFRRVQVCLPVTLKFIRGQNTLKTELKTLSIGGCFTRITDPTSSRLPELNENVSLEVHFFGNEVLEINKGRVASVSWAGSNSGIGIEFVDLDPRAKKLLGAIVKSHST